MAGLLLSSEKELKLFDEKTLVVAIDDTGHEEFKDPNHKVFGLGGCAFLVRDYERLIEKPWNYMCSEFFPVIQRPFHAADIRFTQEQIGAVKHFFENFQFFRIAAVASYKTQKEGDVGFIQIIGATLLQKICEIAQWVEFDRLLILFEASDRIENQVLGSLSNKKIRSKSRTIPIELAIIDKSHCMPAMEVADVIIHTVGAQTRIRNENPTKLRPDFEIIFRNVDKRLTSFSEITGVKNT